MQLDAARQRLDSAAWPQRRRWRAPCATRSPAADAMLLLLRASLVSARFTVRSCQILLHGSHTMSDSWLAHLIRYFVLDHLARLYVY